MITLGREFISPNETFPASADDLLAEAADHSTEVDLAHYAIVHGAVPRLSNSSLTRHRWLAKEWSSLLGIGPQKPPEPVHVTGMTTVSEKLLDVRELATKISDMVADTVMNKLAAIGLTTENIKKLENLGKAPSLDIASGGSRTASAADAISSKLTAKNIENHATIAEGVLSLPASANVQEDRTLHHPDDDADEIPQSEDLYGDSACQGSVSGLQSVGRPKHRERPLLTDTQRLAAPFRPPKKLPSPLKTFQQPEKARSYGLLPMQSSGQRKRSAESEATTREVMDAPPKNRPRYKVNCENDKPSMENTGTDTRESVSVKIQVDIPLHQ